MSATPFLHPSLVTGFLSSNSAKIKNNNSLISVNLLKF